jgi:hypothetical protein
VESLKRIETALVSGDGYASDDVHRLSRSERRRVVRVAVERQAAPRVDEERQAAPSRASSRKKKKKAPSASAKLSDDDDDSPTKKVRPLRSAARLV